MTKSWEIFAKWALIGTFGLSAFYFLLSTLISKSFTHSFDQFISLQPWITFLILTFGVQIGLYKIIRSKSSVIGATGTVNGTTMVLCCAHHTSELLPFLGLSGISLILTSYQKDFLILGVIVNLFVIFYFSKFLSLSSVKKVRYTFLAVFLLTTAFGILFVSMDMYKKMFSPIEANAVSFNPETKQMGVVEVEVVPKELMHDKPVVFTIKLSNHSIDLGYDYTKIATLVDSEGNIYKPVSWSGGMGGHHVSGDLVFGNLSSGAESIGLNIQGIDNQNAVFEWKL